MIIELKKNHLMIGCLSFGLLTTLGNAGASTPAWSQILQPYKTALTDLIKAHETMTPKQPISLAPGSLITSTYQKIITPYVAYISGYARIVASELARGFPYHKDLTELVSQYAEYEKEVKQIVQLLPASVQAQALELFYQDLTSSVVQICYNIIAQSAANNDISDAALVSAYQAYQLAWRTQTPSMTLSGVTSVAEFTNNINQNMQSLFGAAVVQVQTLLTAGCATGSKLEVLYKKLEQYHQILSLVYTNSGDTDDATAQQDLMTAVQQQQQNYQKAVKLQKQADDMLQTARARKAILLDVVHVAQVNTLINNSKSTLADVSSLYSNASGLYDLAQDLVGQSDCTYQQNIIDMFDLFLRTIQTLWNLYLVDQSVTNNIESYPALQLFVTGQAGTVQNATASLQNVIALGFEQSSYSNVIGALESTAQNLVIATLLGDAIAAAQPATLNQNLGKNQIKDSLLDMVLLQDAQSGLIVLQNLCNAMLDAVNQFQASQPTNQSMAQAMTYAKQLDQAFLKQNNIEQYIPNLPACLVSQPTWVNFAAQFFVQAGLVSSSAQATALAGSVLTTPTKQASPKDLLTLQNQATQWWNQAATAATALEFAQAATLYEKAMKAYEKVANLELVQQQQNTMLGYANYAKTRFVASSFASQVQSSGSATFGSIKNIPTSYLAISYQLSIDSTVLNVTLPTFLSSLTVGQQVTTVTPSVQQDLFNFIKAYLVAQSLQDQGRTFTDYYSDYHMTTMLQASPTVQSVVAQISTYVQDFDNVAVTSLTMQTPTTVVILLTNFPLACVTPICSTVSTAATYYSSAALLFAAQKQNITFGGQTYLPGNDSVSANVMLQNLGYAYASAAQVAMAQVSEQMQNLEKLVGVSAKAAPANAVPAKTLPKGFASSLQSIQNSFLTVQALLYAPTDSAYASFVSAGATDLAAAVAQEFLNLYQAQVAFMEQFFIGDPSTDDYQALVGGINQIYVQWASQLNPTQDGAQISQLNEKIGQLYELAGTNCLNFTYYDHSFLKIAQVHYMTAAQYFKAAQLQYQSLNNTIKAQALGQKLNHMYYLACLQNLALYQSVKQYGMSYQSTSSGTSEHVTFEKLVQDFESMSAGPSEQNVVSEVQKLLFDAAIIYEQLGSVSSPKQPSAKTAKSATGKPTAKKVKNSANQTIFKFLTSHEIVTAQDVSVDAMDYLQPGIKEKIIALATKSKTFKKFVTQPDLFVAWNQVLFNVVQYQYLQDFLGAQSDSAQLSSQIQQFVTALQNEVSNFQNPSSVYVS